MRLKRLIKEKQILAQAATMELELPGEPMIYSIKYTLKNRTLSTQFFRNMQWKSLFKSYFKSYYNTNTPVVVIVRFYVSAPASLKISSRNLKSEKTPAVKAYELCDYLLSFLEMLHHVLINSYCQIVKVDAEKYYSNNPRTVFQFMKWDHYVEHCKNNDTVHAES